MQLEMSITARQAALIPPWTPPPGYTLRGYQEGDIAQWSELLLLVGFDEWWPERLRDKGITAPERREGSRLIVYNDEQIVACTMASQHSVQPPVGALDFVSAHPAHSGKGLGYGVCAAVTEYLVGRGYERVVLHTDDWRLPAIKTYLNMGFQPQIIEPDMPERWRKVCEQLNWPCAFDEPDSPQ